MENFIIKNANKKFILIEDNDDQFKNASISFIKGINYEYEKFLEQHKKIAEEYHQKTKDLNIKYFENEFIQTNSPLTILNAKWGQGKTYFIHKFLYNFYENKKNKKQLKNDFYFKHFQDVCLINVWNYATKNNIPFELINNILTILILMNEKSYKIKNLLKAIKKIFLNLEIEASINFLIFKLPLKFSKKNDKEKEIKNEKKLDDLIEELNLNKEELSKTIIILDNIERLNNDSWEIIKCINKLSKIKNLFFILPMNINVLNSNKKAEKEFECPIEKYIFNSIFELKQDYLPILKKLLPKSKINNYLNQMLKIDINEQKLSLRRLEKRIISNNFKTSSDFDFSDDYLFRHFIKNIWGELTIYKKYIKKNLSKIYDEWIYIVFEINNLFDIFKNFYIVNAVNISNFSTDFFKENFFNLSKEIRTIYNEHYFNKNKLILNFASVKKNKLNINVFYKHFCLFKNYDFLIKEIIKDIDVQIKKEESSITKITQKKEYANQKFSIQTQISKNFKIESEIYRKNIFNLDKEIRIINLKITDLNNCKKDFLNEIKSFNIKSFDKAQEILNTLQIKIEKFYKIKSFCMNCCLKVFKNKKISNTKYDFLSEMEYFIIKNHINI